MIGKPIYNLERYQKTTNKLHFFIYDILMDVITIRFCLQFTSNTGNSDHQEIAVIHFANDYEN